MEAAKKAREREKTKKEVKKAFKQAEENLKKMNKAAQQVLEEKEKTKYMGSPGLLNSSEKQKKKDNLVEALSNIKKRFPDKTDKEILDALNNWDVTPTKDGRIKIEIDGQLVFQVDNYDNNLGAYYALSSDDGLGIISGGLYSLSKIVQTKAPGNYVMDFSGDFVSLEMQGALVAEGIAAQKYNSKLQEMKNLNKPLQEQNSRYAYKGERNSSVDFINGKGKSTLKKHYEEHRKDFKVSNEGEYLNQAQNFLQKSPTPTTQSFVSQEGTYFRYDTATNEFGIINQYGGISTYFKPDIANYWEMQITKYAPK